MTTKKTLGASLLLSLSIAACGSEAQRPDQTTNEESVDAYADKDTELLGNWTIKCSDTHLSEGFSFDIVEDGDNPKIVPVEIEDNLKQDEIAFKKSKPTWADYLDGVGILDAELEEKETNCRDISNLEKLCYITASSKYIAGTMKDVKHDDLSFNHKYEIVRFVKTADGKKNPKCNALAEKGIKIGFKCADQATCNQVDGADDHHGGAAHGQP